MPTLEIGGRAIGDGASVFVIAEACDNHLGDLARAKEMARLARLAGADAVKFQHHLPDEEMLPDVPMSDNFEEPLYEFLQKYSLRLADHVELMRYCARARDPVHVHAVQLPGGRRARRDGDRLVQDRLR